MSKKLIKAIIARLEEERGYIAREPMYDDEDGTFAEYLYGKECGLGEAIDIVRSEWQKHTTREGAE